MTGGARECHFDGLPGPTHNFAGLANGNFASMEHRWQISNPRRAALESLEKMKLLHDLGIPQAILPPHPRPDLETLRRLGFAGNDRRIIEKCRHDDPALLAAAYSASSMWAANSATVSPGADTADSRVHFTPANMVSQLHRALETSFHQHTFRTLFPDETAFVHHRPLPACLDLADEGAANHTRLCPDYHRHGLHLFVYGREGGPSEKRPTRFPTRQTRAASRAIARQHQLAENHIFFCRQNPAAIDAVVFHNDVIGVGNLNLLLCHECAYVDQGNVLSQLRRNYFDRYDEPLQVIELPEALLPLKEAVETYLFNSQLVCLPDGGQMLIAPAECRDQPRVQRAIDFIREKAATLDSVRYVDLVQSMKNGGGPACLRLRVVLTEAVRARTHPGVWLNETLYRHLVQWVQHHYREQLHAHDLGDPQLIVEAQTALDELTRILKLGSFYPFQTAAA